MTWPQTVATAAPNTSRRGKKPIPKMKKGSRMILMTAPVAWVIIVKKVFPVDCSKRSKTVWMKIGTEKMRMVDRY